jgi:hypothetical protein
MFRKFTLSLVLLGILPIFIGCGGNGSPVAPMTDIPSLDTNSTGITRPHNMLWGIWDVVVDLENETIDSIPLRGVMFNANVTKFLQPPSSPINLLTLSINPGSQVQFGYLDVDVTIRHPFIGAQKFRGFDVRGIVMGEGMESFEWDVDATRSGEGELQCLNADGYTRWWNPVEFTTYETIFGYSTGAYVPAGYMATATVSPYKYFADDLDTDTPVTDLNPDNRGTFGVEPGINTRNYLLQFPVLAGGGPVYHFNYAIDASWALPSDDYVPDYPVEAFPPEANMQEAWMVTLDDSESTAWYVDDAQNGGFVKLAIEVFDWQAPLQQSGVSEEVSAIWIESPVINGPKEVSTWALPQPSGPVSSVWNVEITDLSLTSAGMFECWIGVEASYPENYAPVIDGDPGMFDWPDKPLTAFFQGTLNIKGENPVLPPEVISVIPPKGPVSTVMTDLEIFGANFIDGAVVEFDQGMDSLAVTNTTWIDPGLITCDLNTSGPLGFYDVTVTNPDTQYDTLEFGFEVVDVFECTGSAHDWADNWNPINGIPPSDVTRFEMTILKQGTYAGMLLFQMTETQWGIVDPDGGPGQTITPIMTTSNAYVNCLEACDVTNRLGIVSQSNKNVIWVYDQEGNYLGDFEDTTLDPTKGNIIAMDFDAVGDLRVATRIKLSDTEFTWELRHYAYLDTAPFYEIVPADTVEVTGVAMTGPVEAQGVGDIGISFYLNRLFLFTANHADGGSNKITSWDLNQSPPVLIETSVNPFPPLMRHHIFGTGAFSRMDIDVDHRFDNDIYEQCRIYAHGTVWTWGPPALGVDCYVIRLDGDLNILDEGAIFHPNYPAEFDQFQQCVILNDTGPMSNANLIGCDWSSDAFTVWPVPADW